MEIKEEQPFRVVTPRRVTVEGKSGVVKSKRWPTRYEHGAHYEVLFDDGERLSDIPENYLKPYLGEIVSAVWTETPIFDRPLLVKQ